jgi:DNA (cytosine-5)-methyltransferase 1
LNATAATAPLAWASKHGADGERPIARAANDNEGLIIDLFAGGGGASEGVFEATGRHPDIGVNHDHEALSMHEVNHPSTLHVCEDIRKVDIPALLALKQFAGRFVDFLWASPDCKDHSKAKGGTPKDKNIRGLAWEVLRWCAAIKRVTGRLPSCVVIENVEEFADWGPLHRYGKKAGRVNKKRRRELFNLWISQFRALGFTAIDWRELVAADFEDTPTTRKRLFIVLRSDGGAISWPTPTNAKHVSTGDLFAAQVKAWAPAADIIDWSIPIPSIFGRKRPLKEKTHARLARGIKRFVIEAAAPFIVPVTNMKWGGDRVRPATEPMKTVATEKGGGFAFAAPTIMPVTHGGAIDRSYSPMAALPAVTGAHRGEMTLVSAFLKPRYGEREGQEPRVKSLLDPAPTPVPTGNGGDLAGVFLHRQFGSAVSGRPISEPHPAVMADGGGGKSHLVVAHLSSIAYGDGWARPGGRATPLQSPIGVVTGANDKVVVAAHLLRTDMQSAADRNGIHAATDALRTITSAGGFALAGVSLLRFTKGSVGTDLAGPMLTPVSHSKDALLAVHMDQHNGDQIGRPAAAPVTTLTHRATQQKLAAAVIDKYYGSGVAHGLNQPFGAATAKARFSISSAFLEQANTGMVGHDLRKPVSTIVGGGADSGWGTTQRLIDVSLESACAEIGAPAGSRRRDVLEFLWAHFGKPTAEEWAAPLATAQARLRFGLVVIEGAAYAIVDIGMRMLVPRELYRAQGFRDHYVIDRTADGRPLSKTAQTRMAGNSVCPRVAKAIARCNAPQRILLPERLAA